jgi:methionine-gamma-lyase
MTSRKKPVVNPETLLVHGADPSVPARPISVPIDQATTFPLPSAEMGAALQDTPRAAAFYGRWGSPTVNALEDQLAVLEGTEEALSFSSGMAAITASLLANLSHGDHVVASLPLYGGTHELIAKLLPRFGIRATLVDARDGGFEGAVGNDTRLIYVETPANPTLQLVDLESVAALGKDRNLLTVCDSTFATPLGQSPAQLGIDLVVHAATKFIGGHSDAFGGVLAGPQSLIERAWQVRKLLGSILDPFAAWLLIRGLKTLKLRFERQCATALQLAGFLEQHPAVARVHYPGLASHPQHALARRQMRNFGGVFSFELKGGAEAARHFVEHVQVARLAVSLGSVETLVQLPVSMTHGQIPGSELAAGGVSPGLVRVSAGLENTDDLKSDFEAGLTSLLAHRHAEGIL